MEQKPSISDIRHVLLQKLVREELQQSRQAGDTAQRVDTQSQKGRVATRLVPLQAGSRTPFFFLHGDWTGNVAFCFKLAHALGPDQPFYILDPYSFEGYQVPLPLETIAAKQLALIRQIQPEGPYLLGGFCNGGLVVYEMARQLLRSGQKVDLLVLIDPMPPHFTRILKVFNHMSSLLHLSQEQQLAWFLRLHHVFVHLIQQRPDGYEFIKTFDPRIDAWFPPVETLRQEYTPLLFWAIAEYKPIFYPGKVIIFWDEAEPVRRRRWQRMMKGKDREVEVAIIRGSHDTCKTEFVDDMAACLRQYLVKVQEENSTSP